MKRLLLALVAGFAMLAWADSAAANISQTWANATAGQALQGYTEAGSAWTDSCGDWKFSTATPRRLYQITTYGGCTSTLAYTPLTPNYDVSVDFYHASTVSESSFDVRGRISGNSYYRVTYSVDNGGYSLSKVVNGSSSPLCTYASTPATASIHTPLLRMRGSTISMLVDGTSVCSVTDTSITAAGVPGLGGGYLSYAGTDTTGDQLNDFTETDASGLYATAISGFPGNGTASGTVSASGGTAPYTYQWYRSTTSGQLGTAIAGQTSSTLADTGLTNNVAYYYTAIVTDSTSGTALTSTSNQFVEYPTAYLFGQNVLPGLYWGPTGTANTACTFSRPCTLLAAVQLAAGASAASLYHDASGYIPLWGMGGVTSIGAVINLGSSSYTYLDIKSMYGQTAVLDGGGSTAEPLYCSGGGNHLKIRHLTIQNFASNGLLFNNCSNIVVDSNVIHDITGNGVPNAAILIIGSSAAVTSNYLITHNLVYNITAFGIAASVPAYPVNYVTEEFNLVHDTCKGQPDCSGLYAGDQGYEGHGYAASVGDRIRFNIAYNTGSAANGKAGDCLYADDGESNSSWYGNVCYGLMSWGMLIHGGDHNFIANNSFDLGAMTETAFHYQGESVPGGGVANTITANLLYSSTGTLGSVGGAANNPTIISYYTSLPMAAPSFFRNAFSFSGMNVGTFVDPSPTVSAGMNFRAAASNDYRFTAAGSPLAAFRGIDTSQVGPVPWAVPIPADVIAARHLVGYVAPAAYTPPVVTNWCAVPDPQGDMPAECWDFSDGVYTKAGVSYASAAAMGGAVGSGCTAVVGTGASCPTGVAFSLPHPIPSGSPYLLVVAANDNASVVGTNADLLLSAASSVREYQNSTTGRNANGANVAGASGESAIWCAGTAANSAGFASSLDTLGVAETCPAITPLGNLIVANTTAAGANPVTSPYAVQRVRIYLPKVAMTALSVQRAAGRQ